MAQRTDDKNKKYICKHCKVQVVSKFDTRPVLGREHGKHCPRRNK
jgi:hypothetical protein